MRLHVRYCAGGDRSDETWVPYREVYAERARHVLVVDDDPDVRAALRMLLQAVGHRVDEASEARSALALVVERTPEVVFVDINLPGMNGYELARRIREQLGPATPRLIALTGYGRPEDRRRAREAGFDEFLLKPADADEIEGLIAGAPRR